MLKVYSKSSGGTEIVSTNSIKRKRKNEDKYKKASKKYNVIYADPPWEYKRKWRWESRDSWFTLLFVSTQLTP